MSSYLTNCGVDFCLSGKNRIVEGWEAEYAAFCTEKEAIAAKDESKIENKNDESWAVEYAAYCMEREAELQH